MLEALYREVTLKRQLQVTFKDMMREIEGLVDQMGDKERRLYLVESLFLNSVTYENEMLDAYMRRLTATEEEGARTRVSREVAMRRPFLVGAFAAAAGLALGRRAPLGPTTKDGTRSAEISVEPASFDFGKALPDKVLEKQFSIRNFGDADLVIERVTTTCGCTAALLEEDSKVLKPGKQRPAPGAPPHPRLLGEDRAQRHGALERSDPGATRDQGRGGRATPGQVGGPDHSRGRAMFRVNDPLWSRRRALAP